MDKKKTTPSSQGQGQDNIGYENTEKRTDRDDKEMNRLQTTDTGNEEDKESAGEKEEDNNDRQKVFGQL